MDEEKAEKKRILYSLLFPGGFVVLLWIVKGIELALEVDFASMGLYPMETKGLWGIILGPLIHGDLGHLAANSVPLLILGTGIFYFYRPISLKVFFFIYFTSGMMLWFGGREGYHIGASGLVYGFAAFLFLSGILRKHIRLMAISLLVVFLYGGMVWGVLPIDPNVSWEGHLFGGLAGFVVAFYYKDQGPQRKKYQWEIDEEMEEMDMDYYDWLIYDHFRNKKRKGEHDDENE
jgi:membrane associated rhomboid family serine protease